MAIYRRGTAGLTANGVVTGVDTKWQDKLSLIRVGATMVFLTQPLTLVTISAIVSDTEMRAIQTDDAVVPDGTNYVILLHDSITVDGLAQDVAETLRYYQSKETVIQDAMDFFHDFDIDQWKAIQQKVETDANRAAVSEANAANSAASASSSEQVASDAAAQAMESKQSALDSASSASASASSASDSEQSALASKASAELYASNAKSSEDNAEISKNAAESSASSALASETSAKSSSDSAALSASNAASSEASASASASSASDSASASALSESKAKTSEDNAKISEDNAKDWAQSVNPDNLLKVDQNLADLGDRVQAWLNVRPVGNTPLGGDPVNPGDATTQRWVLNAIGSGATGPTMNGVMNYGVGTPSPWISRAYIPPFALPLDGQLVNRADWPELWAHAQQHGVITDSAWVADVTKRGSYSSGDGSTTFRLPDWNGASGGLANLFFRGGSNSATDKVISDSAAPNITAVAHITLSGTTSLPLEIYSGAISYDNPSSNALISGSLNGGSIQSRQVGINFNASRSSPVYGRSSNEVYPRNIAGVWIVRASGGFTAANTSWSVNNADQSAPSTGSSANGGSVRSVYKVGASEYASADFRVKAIGGSSPTAEVLLTDNSSGTSSTVAIGIGVPKSYIDGLDVRVLSSGVTVYPGSAAMGNTGEVVEVKSAITVPLPTLEASTFFYVYLYSNGGSAAVEISKTAPVKYSGKASGKGSDTSRRFLGYYRVTSSSEVAECNMIDGLARFIGPNDANAMLRILSNGQSTTYAQIPIAGYIHAGIARSIIFDGTNSAASSGPVVAYSGVSGRTYSTFQSGTNKYEAEVMFNNPSSPELWYKYSSSPGAAGFFVDIKGFRYDR